MKKILILLGVLVVLVVVAYFVVTSSGVLKSIVLPRVGTALNARVDAESIALSPFSSLEIRKLSVVPNGAEPLAAVDRVLVRYSLMDLVRGRMNFDEILISNPTVTLVRKADGTSNLDPVLARLEESSAKSKPANSTPAQVDLRSLRVENANLSVRSTAADGSSTTAELGRLAVTVRDVKNGGKGRIELAGGLKFDQRPGPGPGGAGMGAFQAQLDGGFDLGLSQDLAPTTATGRTTLQVHQASGTLADYQGFSSVLSVDLTPTELTRAAIEFARGGTALGSATAAGPLDLARKEGKLKVDITAIDRNVLNLVATPMGLDFAETRFDSANQIDIEAGGQRIAVQGTLTGTRVGVRKGSLAMPPVDLKQTHDLAVDLGAQSVAIRAFNLSGTQGGREVLQGRITQPMQVSWSPNHGPLPDATFEAALNKVQFSDWSALVGAGAQGTLDARATIGVRRGGKDLAIDGTALLAGLTGVFAGNAVTNLGLQATANAAIPDFADSAQRRLTTTTRITNLNGQAAMVRFNQYGLDATADIGLPEGSVVIRDAQLRLRRGTQDGGLVSLKGQWKLEPGTGEIIVSAKDVNQSGLEPFLQAALGEKQLRGVRLDSDASVKVEPGGASAVKVSANVKDLVVHDPAGTVPESPLALGFVLDAGGSNDKLTIRQGTLRLTPTARASNELQLTGDVDYSKTNAIKGGLKLTADALDVTTLYDMFTGGAKPETPATKPPVSEPTTEPEAIKLPVESLTVDAAIAKLFLRDIAVTDFNTSLRIQGSRIEVAPIKLALNGAPVAGSLQLDVGVPGYTYDVKLNASEVPMKPFADSFIPMLKNRIGGAAQAGLDVKGAGITGVNLKKSLVGGMSFAVTNANLKLTDSSARKGILTLLTSLLASALNIRELQDQPIMDIVANAKMGEGKIDIREARFRSASLEGGIAGPIPIADDLMKSPLAFPVNISLNRDLAQRARLLSSDTPTNALYVALPSIAALKGTLGEPATEIDKVKTALLVARGIGGLVGAGGVIGGATNAVGNLIQGIGGVLGAGRGNTNAPITNAVGNLIKGIGGLLGGGTNAPKVTNNASGTNAPVKDPIGGLLKGIFDKKKE